MAKNSKTCPECGGPARGRGFAHVAGCSKATKAKGSKRAGGRKKKAVKRKSGIGEFVGHTTAKLAEMYEAIRDELRRRLG
jgi:hypothetical protein